MKSSVKPTLVIKPFKKAPSLPVDYEEKTWNLLKKSIACIHSKTRGDENLSKEELYQAVEGLCIHKLSPHLYTNLQQVCQEHIYSCVDSLSTHVYELKCTNNYIGFLSIVNNIWYDHCEQMMTIRNIFLYLDRSYTQQHSHLLSIWDMGIHIFHTRLVEQSETIQSIMLSLLALIEQERQYFHIDTEIVRNVIRMLFSLGLYSLFESLFIEDSKRFFQELSLSTYDTTSPLEYLVQVEKRLLQANTMISNYLQSSTRSSLIQVIEYHFLLPNIEHCIQLGLPLALEYQQLYQLQQPNLDEIMRFNDLKRIYQLCERVNQFELLNKYWAEYIKSAGLVYVGINNNTTSSTLSSTTTASDIKEFEKTIIENLLNFHELLEIVLKNCFRMNDLLKSTLKSSFEYFINSNKSSNKIARLLVLYVDVKLRSEKTASQEEVEAYLERSMLLFRVLNEKDTYEAFYKKYLSKRLLQGKSANYDTEKSMISHLKSECGANYTAKLEGMFTDMDLSKDVMTSYTTSINNSKNDMMSIHASSSTNNKQQNNIDFSVQVLSSGYWPSPPTGDLVLSSTLSQQINQFSSFYNEKYQGRRLAWAHNLDKCIVIARFPKGKKELEVTLYQALVLQCFNLNDSSKGEDKTFTLSQVHMATGIEVEELRRVLQSLACGDIGTRVLTKDPKGKDVLNTDLFHFNVDFTSKLFRIKIRSIQVKESETDVEQTNEEVFRDRQYAVDANIVRIMKARKQLSHNVLIGEILSQLKFPVNNADIKRRIESLIERDYLERDKTDTTIYKYLA